MPTKKIRVENLTKLYGKGDKKEALKLLNDGVSKKEIQQKTGRIVGVSNVSFTVEEGEIFVVMGLSGSGKSTLIRCVNRLIEPTSGHIYINDEDILAVDQEKLRQLRRTLITMVFQHFALFPHKTVVENAAYGLKVQGLDAKTRREKAIEALELVGLEGWADHYPRNLSGGMQQRVGLARALATEAEVLLMDEAFSALDPLIRREMQDELLQLQDRLKKTVLFITHDLNEALRVGSRVAVLQQDGRVAQIGTPIEIVTQPANDYVAEFTQDVDPGRVLTAEYVMQPAEALKFSLSDSPRAILKKIKVADANELFLIDDERHPQGILLKQDVINAVRNDKQDLSEIIYHNFPKTNLTTSFSEIYAMCADGLPVAVVDEKSKKLKGMIDPLDVLANLGNGTGE